MSKVLILKNDRVGDYFTSINSINLILNKHKDDDIEIFLSKINYKFNFIFQNLKNRILVLRISNLIGVHKYRGSNKKIHKTFIDIFFSKVQKGIIFNNAKNYKDFLSINKFNEIVEKLINKKAVGIYNVSLGKKVYLNKLIKWLNLFNKNKYKYIDTPKSYKTECFYLNNDKLMKKINIKNRLIDLENDCKTVSRVFFKKKNK